MIKLAVFDLDGTLVDSLTDLALSVNKGLEKAGLPTHPIEKYNKFVGNGREMLIRRAIGDGCTDELFETVLKTFDEEYRLIVSKDIKNHYTSSEAKSYFICREGRKMILPVRFQPSQDLLEKHRVLLVR